jgi:Fuc2NAc and GlcNAc transferase
MLSTSTSSGVKDGPLLLTLLLGGGLVVVIGFVDDHRHLSVRVRFAFHFVAAVIAVALLEMPGVDLPPGLAVSGWGLNILYAIGLVWLLNLYNFMDGIDGIASVEGVSVLCCAVSILLLDRAAAQAMLPLLMLAACITGFLLWNWPPARIFMGDAGSGFLGYALGVFALYTAEAYSISLWSWLILLGLFIVDATWTLVIRISSGDKWYLPHAKHAYQHLARNRQSVYLQRGMSPERSRSKAHRWVTLLCLSINLLWLFPLAWFADKVPGYGAVIALLAYLPLVVAARMLGAGRD